MIVIDLFSARDSNRLKLEATIDSARARISRPIVVSSPEDLPVDRKDDWPRSGWWFLEKDYRQIIQVYEAGRLNLGTVARSAGAVQPSWSRMDVSIEARVIQDINVYIGKGKTQYRDLQPNGMYMTLTGWPTIVQMYIPGMLGTSITALQIYPPKIITTDNLGLP